MQPEEEIQCAVVEFLRLQYPKVKFTISPISKLTIGQAMKRKRMGYVKGSPDLMIFHAKEYRCEGLYSSCGLFIELKTKTGRTSQEQNEWGEYLNNNGYVYAVCHGIDEAIAEVRRYMNG